jgi:hypothetical protein
MQRPSDLGDMKITADSSLTYIIKIAYTENRSVQGYIRWVEEDSMFPSEVIWSCSGLSRRASSSAGPKQPI